MLLDEMMEDFVSRIPAVEELLAAARDDLNRTSMPEGLAPLRLNREEVRNIVGGEMAFRDDGDDPALTESVNEGVATLMDQLFLMQFSNSLEEASAEFGDRLIGLMRHDPMLARELAPIVRVLREPTDGRSSEEKKLRDVTAAVDAVLDHREDDLEWYVLRVLDEIAHFADAMLFPLDPLAHARPEPANDNVPARKM